MNKLDINGFYLVTSFLEPSEIKKLGTSSKYVYNNCRNFMTYLYSEYGCNESHYKMNTAKWIVENCNRAILVDCINKNLAIESIVFNNCFNEPLKSLTKCKSFQQITFGPYFNQPIEALASCINLRRITFGLDFNQPIEALANCTNLQQITFGCSFNQPIEALVNLPNLKITRD